MNFIARLLVVPALLAGASWAHACDTKVPLDGSTQSVKSCGRSTPGCQPAMKALHDYMDASDDSPERLTIGLQASPWRMYDGESRILRIEDMVPKIRPLLKPEVKVVELQGSWTGVAPGPGGKSLAQRLSLALGGFRVTGMDGFMWVKPDGSLHSTRQSFTVREGSGPYGVPAGGEIMASLAYGALSDMQSDFETRGDAFGVLAAAVGWDVYYLCPDKALDTFEVAAKMGNAIAAYNAAVIRLERKHPGDRDAAMKLLERGAALDDAKSAALLGTLKAISKVKV